MKILPIVAILLASCATGQYHPEPNAKYAGQAAYAQAFDQCWQRARLSATQAKGQDFVWVGTGVDQPTFESCMKANGWY